MPAEYKDYYKVLGISRTASEKEIKSAYRDLARKNHPDKAGDDAEAARTFKEVNEAYDVLGDADRRKRFDELGTDYSTGQQLSNWEAILKRFGRSGGTAPPKNGFSSFYDQLFAGVGGTVRHDDDDKLTIEITPEQAWRGEKGSFVPQVGPHAGKKLSIKLPQPAYPGRVLRLAGQGLPGADGKLGDLNLVIEWLKDSLYRYEDDRLVRCVNITAPEAALGTKISVPIYDKSVSLRVPPGTAHGAQLRLKGMGLPRDNGERGELFLEFCVVIPNELSATERPLWEALLSGESKPTER